MLTETHTHSYSLTHTHPPLTHIHTHSHTFTHIHTHAHFLCQAGTDTDTHCRGGVNNFDLVYCRERQPCSRAAESCASPHGALGPPGLVPHHPCSVDPPWLMSLRWKPQQTVTEKLNRVIYLSGFRFNTFIKTIILEVKSKADSK